MSIKIGKYPADVKKAVKVFWLNRKAAKDKKKAVGKKDQGNRGSATAGKNMDGFLDILEAIVKNNGLENAHIHRRKSLVTLPGYFRPTKQWDLVVFNEDELVAVIELKSLCGPSFGNNANNRGEEALGSSLDFHTALREGAYGKGINPYLGYLLLIEDDEATRKPIRTTSHHFPIYSEYIKTSYQQRMHLLCERMRQERLYSSAAVISSQQTTGAKGAFKEVDPSTSIKRFLSEFAATIAAHSNR